MLQIPEKYFWAVGSFLYEMQFAERILLRRRLNRNKITGNVATPTILFKSDFMRSD
jgi:hypothetical protein